MKHTTTGLPDASIRETQTKLDSLLNVTRGPNALVFPTYFGIFLNSTGELIGDGGIHTLASPACGWPELGCKFAREQVGRGYGTEFLRAFTSWWWALPRYKEGVDGEKPVQVRVRVHPDTVIWERDQRAYSEDRSLNADNGRSAGEVKDVAVELLYAWIAPDNHASQKMVIKTGLEHFITWQHPTKKITVLGWRQSRYRRLATPCKL
jgi:RimJ/RimL family protein N-acetyltransferase